LPATIKRSKPVASRSALLILIVATFSSRSSRYTRGAIETAKRIRQRMSAVFVFGIASGICDADPAAIVTKALKPLGPKGRQPAVVDLEELRALLAKVEAENASPLTLLAHRMLALTAVRSGTLREAQWEEFEDLNGDKPLWRIPASKLKLAKHAKLDGGRDHLVPLQPAAVEVLRAVKPLTGNALYVFPNHRRSHQPMSENAIGYLLNRAGYHGRHVPHGWRSAFSTIMNEKAASANRHSDRWIIDAMLGHVHQGKVEAAYNRAEHMKRRREIAEEWADLLTESLAPAATLLGTARRW
jgi:integrase